MYGLVDVDVTAANRLLACHDPPGSLTAFVVASVARAVAAHPEVHAYRNWRGQLVTHHHVDVATMVGISTRQGPFAIPHVLRDADVRGVPELTARKRRRDRASRLIPGERAGPPTASSSASARTAGSLVDDHSPHGFKRGDPYPKGTVTGPGLGW